MSNPCCFFPVSMLYLLLWLPCRVEAQATFHLRLDSLRAPSGLSLLTNGYLIGGDYGDCVRLLRLDLFGNPVWTQEICTLDPADYIDDGSVHLSPGNAPDEFFALLRISSVTGPKHKPLLLKGNGASGSIDWQCLLPTYVSFGPLPSGHVAATGADGASWVVHSQGDISLASDDNQVLLFRVSATGKLIQRDRYVIPGQSVANGICLSNGTEALVYGGLGYSKGDGFLLKLDGTGAVQWAKRYADFSFYRDGGTFQNGDLLLYGEDQTGVAFARVSPEDGSVLWRRRIVGLPASALYAVAADQGIFAVVNHQADKVPDAVLKLGPDDMKPEWFKAFETCTDFFFMSALPTADTGLVLLQDANSGPNHVRALKVNAAGKFTDQCLVFALPVPILEELPTETGDLVFTHEQGTIPTTENWVRWEAVSMPVREFCPSLLPEAGMHLPDSACAGSPLSLLAEGNEAADTWNWILPGTLHPETEGRVLVAVYPETGLYAVTLIQQTGVCADTIRDSIYIAPGLDMPLFSFSDTLLCRDSNFLALPSGGPYDAWEWEDGSTGFERLFAPAKAGAYALKVEKDGCSLIDSFAVNLARCGALHFFVPNAFAPDGGMDNAVWEIRLPEGIEPLSCAVFDRWGNQVYSAAQGETPHWNGIFRGKAAAPGVYGWILRVRDEWDGQEETRSGEVLLLR